MTDGNVRGIEHVGITVPDIVQATEFLRAAFGAEQIYDMLDEPLGGEFVRTTLGVPIGTAIEQIRMLRLGNGANIELFEYASVDQQGTATPSDLGLQHIAVYVEDIDAAARRFADSGGTCLTAPLDLPAADAGPGNKFLYCRAPWGTMIELICCPSAQAYEATTELRRWRPPARG